MSGLRKLVDEETDELLLSVLRSAEDDIPGPGQRERTLAALGVGGPVGGSAGATAKLFGTSMWKWAVSALVVSAAVGGALLSWPSAPSSSPEALSRSAPTEPTQPVAPAPVPERDGVGAVAAPPTVPSASADVVAPVAPRPSPSAQSRPSPKPGLGAELAALDEARTALGSGDAARALTRLDRYDREFATPVLAQEATMLRIEALRAKGDTSAARTLATRFLATHPSTTYEDRVRTLLGPGDDPR